MAEFEDSENWQSKTIGIKEIALEQYRRCMIEGSKTFSGNDGPKQTETYINCIISMETILYGKILDKANYPEINANITNNEEKISSTKKEYKTKYQKLKDNQQKINEELMTTDLQHDLRELYREKLIILSLLLEKINWFSEIGIEDR